MWECPISCGVKVNIVSAAGTSARREGSGLDLFLKQD
jgi:hypothetical protein